MFVVAMGLGLAFAKALKAGLFWPTAA